MTEGNEIMIIATATQSHKKSITLSDVQYVTEGNKRPSGRRAVGT